MGASERDEFLRAAWWAKVADTTQAERFVFVDECSTNVSLRPLYAWSPRESERIARHRATGGEERHPALQHDALGYLGAKIFGPAKPLLLRERRSPARATKPGRATTPVLWASCLSSCTAFLTSY